MKEALEYNERALSIYRSEKLVRRIAKMKVMLIGLKEIHHLICLHLYEHTVMPVMYGHP